MNECCCVSEKAVNPCVECQCKARCIYWCCWAGRCTCCCSWYFVVMILAAIIIPIVLVLVVFKNTVCGLAGGCGWSDSDNDVDKAVKTATTMTNNVLKGFGFKL